MSGFVGPQPIAAAGSTGNNSHTGVQAHPGANLVCVEFVVEAVGATPTVTFALQGTFADSPAATDWFPLATVPSDSDTAAATRAVTAVGRYANYLSLGNVARFCKKLRLVTTANTNVTYSANLWQRYIN